MFQQVLRVAGVTISAYAGVLVTVPNIKNGRCFVMSLALATSPLDIVRLQVIQQRNDMGAPCNPDMSLNVDRHDLELCIAKKMASEIVDKLTMLPHSEACAQRLLLGRVVEEADLDLIATAMSFTLEIISKYNKDKPFYLVNPGQAKTLRFTFSGRRHSETHHWEPVVLVPRRELSRVCIDAQLAVSRVPLTNDRQIMILQNQLAQLEREKADLLRRVAVLEGKAQGADHCRPTKPPSSFALYTQSIRGTLHGRASEQAKQAGLLWRSLSAAEKQHFDAMALQKREEYQAAMQEYRAVQRGVGMRGGHSP